VISLAKSERAQLCDLLDRVGPDAPTLCEGWLARDLAAHLVLREGRPDAAPGIAIDWMSEWTTRVQHALASGNYRRLVQRLRSGPPAWSLFRLPRIGDAANGVEFFVHHEDVRRAQPGWKPRELNRDVQDQLWRRVCRMAPLLTRGVARTELNRTDTGETYVSAGRGKRSEAHEKLSVSGEPAELLLYLYGRREHAQVTLDGDPSSLRAL